MVRNIITLYDLAKRQHVCGKQKGAGHGQSLEGHHSGFSH